MQKEITLIMIIMTTLVVDDHNDNDNVDDDNRRARQSRHFHVLTTLSSLRTSSKTSKLSESGLKAFKAG